MIDQLLELPFTVGATQSEVMLNVDIQTHTVGYATLDMTHTSFLNLIALDGGSFVSPVTFHTSDQQDPSEPVPASIPEPTTIGIYGAGIWIT